MQLKPIFCSSLIIKLHLQVGGAMRVRMGNKRFAIIDVVHAHAHGVAIGKLIIGFCIHDEKIARATKGIRIDVAITQVGILPAAIARR